MPARATRWGSITITDGSVRSTNFQGAAESGPKLAEPNSNSNIIYPPESDLRGQTGDGGRDYCPDGGDVHIHRSDHRLRITARSMQQSKKKKKRLSTNTTLQIDISLDDVSQRITCHSDAVWASLGNDIHCNLNWIPMLRCKVTITIHYPVPVPAIFPHPQR